MSEMKIEKITMYFKEPIKNEDVKTMFIEGSRYEGEIESCTYDPDLFLYEIVIKLNEPFEIEEPETVIEDD